MKKRITTLMAVVLATFIFGAVNAQVSYDYDKTIDFTKYKTYSFAGWQKDSDKVLNDLDKQRILSSFEAEFTARNMTLVKENGDAVVTLYFVIDNKTSTTAYTNYTGGMGLGMGGARWGYGMGGMGMGSSTTSFQDNDYKEGTMVVDVYDAGTKKLAWQGTSQKTINSNAKKRDKTIPKGVKALMKKYPIEAAKK